MQQGFHKTQLETILIAIIPISLLIGMVIINAFEINEASAILGDQRIKEIIKIKGIYIADSEFTDLVIHPPISNVNNTIVFGSFAHGGEDDHSDTFRSYKIINNSTLRVFGEDTATGNIAEDVVFYIIEFRDGTGIDVQHVNFNLTASEPEGLKFIRIDPVNTSRSTIVYRGESHLADETTVGIEEMSRLTLYNSTDISWFVSDTPNSGPQVNRMSVIDWGTPFHSVQRGNGTMTGTLTTISPLVDVIKNRTLLTMTYAYDGALDAPADEVLIRATLNDNNPPDIVIERDDGANNILFSWELTTFPPGTVFIRYENLTMGAGTASVSDTIAQVRDFDKTLVFGTVGTPFGYGTGEASSGTVGAIDRGQMTLILEDNDSVLIERGDSTGTAIIDYVVFEILEAYQPSENPQGTNEIKHVIKFEGEFTEGNFYQDFDFSPALTDPTKSLILMSFSNDVPTGVIESNEIVKSWELIDLDTIRILGSTEPSAVNIGTNFTATIIEFTSSSPIFAQRDEITYAQEMLNGEKVMRMSPVNITGSAIAYNGKSTSGSDPSFGQEEFASVRLLNNTNWGYDVETFQNEAGHRDLVGIVDFNQNDIFVQSGSVSLINENVTVSPSIDIDRDQSILLFSYVTNSADFEEEPNDASIMGTVTTDSPPDLIFSRVSTTDQMEIEWQVISIPDYFATVQHGTSFQDIGIGNSTEIITSLTNSSNSLVIGTSAGLFGYGMGQSNSTETNHFDVSTAKLTLLNNTAFKIERGETNANFEVGWQVIEFLSASQQLEFNLTDSIILIDNYNSTSTFVENITDMITITDMFNSNFTALQNINDTIDILDVFNSELQSGLTLQEIINITDSFTSELSTLEEFAEGLDIDDDFNVSQNIFETLSDTITILDVFNAQLSSELSPSEVITLLDVFDTTLFYSENLPETILITDIFTATLQADFNNIDTIEIIDAFLATCATCSTPTPPSGLPNGGSGGIPSSPIPFGQTGLIDLQVEDITIDAVPGKIIDLTALYSWGIDSQIQIIKFEPERNRWFSTNLPVIQESTGQVPNKGEIPFSFRLPENTCQTVGDLIAQNCYESTFIQFPITVSGVSDGRLSIDTANVTIRIQSGIQIPLIWYIVSGMMIFSLILAWFVAFGRGHNEKGDKVLKRKHTREEHDRQRIKNELRRQRRKKTNKEGSLKERLNSRTDRRTQRPKIVRKKKTVG